MGASQIPEPRTPFRILIVDDQPSHRTLEREILAGPGYELFEVGSGPEALSRLKEEEFDVVLLDKRMPDMDGDEVCLRIRTELDRPLLPVIMVTGSASNDELAKSMAAGANDFVRKPYSPMELVARISAAVAQKRMTDQLDSAESLLFALARMVEAKDEGTSEHCSRLAHVATVFSETLGLGEEERLALRRGGVLHDIGKLGIPDSILLKRAPLNTSEWAIMRQHTVIGARLCEGLNSVRTTIPIIRHHHERWNGSGYPDGLAGEEIPLLARVFQLVDIYDALASERPYKCAWPQERVIATLRAEAEKGWLDPELSAEFVGILETRPDDLRLPGSREKDLGMKIFEDIVATGVLAWDSKFENTPTSYR